MTKREQVAMVTAINKLETIDGTDPEVAHATADDVLLELLTFFAPPDVAIAYKRVMDRCDWWATA